MNQENFHPDYFLDITNDVCPITFVKVRLQIEKMEPGELLEIRLGGSEPKKNVPEAISELGHTILSLNSEANNTVICKDGAVRLVLRKEPK